MDQELNNTAVLELCLLYDFFSFYEPSIIDLIKNNILMIIKSFLLLYKLWLVKSSKEKRKFQFATKSSGNTQDI